MGAGLHALGVDKLGVLEVLGEVLPRRVRQALGASVLAVLLMTGAFTPVVQTLVLERAAVLQEYWTPVLQDAIERSLAPVPATP